MEVLLHFAVYANEGNDKGALVRFLTRFYAEIRGGLIVPLVILKPGVGGVSPKHVQAGWPIGLDSWSGINHHLIANVTVETGAFAFNMGEGPEQPRHCRI